MSGQWPADGPHRHHLGASHKCNFLSPNPDLQNHKLWAWGLAISGQTGRSGFLVQFKLNSTRGQGICQKPQTWGALESELQPHHLALESYISSLSFRFLFHMECLAPRSVNPSALLSVGPLGES